MEREQLNFDSEQGQEIVWGDNPEFQTVETEILSTGRWSINKRIVVKRISDGVFFESNFSQGATEQQDEMPYEYSEAIFTQVKPIQKTITYYGWN